MLNKTRKRNIKNKRLLDALARKPVDRTPVWIMRQAGRYLPEYRAIREKYDFITVCKTPSLSCDVALQPLTRFDLDAAIVFSDILCIPDAMGLGLSFVEGYGPRFDRPIRDHAAIKSLRVPDIQHDLGYVMESTACLVDAVGDRMPVIGFSGAPWTLAGYMIEGNPSVACKWVKKMRYLHPQWVHELLKILTKAVCLYVQAQIEAGADVIMLFDTWGGILSASDYPIFSLQYITEIIKYIKENNKKTSVPTLLFTKGGGNFLLEQARCGCSGLGLDWTVDLNSARTQVGHRVALQGNLDPMSLYADPDTIRSLTWDILRCYQGAPGHIFNLGHGILPDVNPEHVTALIEAVHSFVP